MTKNTTKGASYAKNIAFYKKMGEILEKVTEGSFKVTKGNFDVRPVYVPRENRINTYTLTYYIGLLY